MKCIVNLKMIQIDNRAVSIMQELLIRGRIATFSGNIQATFNLTEELHTHFNFDLDLYFSTSNSLQRFTNIVRNMLSRGVIQKPRKSGRNLIFHEMHLLQFLVARKYLDAGCSMDSLSGYLIGLSNDELYDRLFIKQLPDIELVAQRGSAASVAASPPRAKVEFTRKSYFNIKIINGLNLLVEQGKFSEDELTEMTTYLERFVSSHK